MAWRVLVEPLPGSSPFEATSLEVEASSWVVALRTARELLGFPAPNPRELAVEVRDQGWRIADRSLGRLFVIEPERQEDQTTRAPAAVGPASPADLTCTLHRHAPVCDAHGFDYLEETLVAPRLANLDVAHTWLKLRVAAWKSFRAPASAPFLLRLFAFSAAPSAPDAEPIATAEYRSWSGRLDLLPLEESLAAVASGAHQIPSSPALRASQPPSGPHRSAHVPTPVDLALVGAIVPPPRPPHASLPNEDLIGAIFDSVHDVHFAPTMLDGADLVCDIAFRNIPCAGAFVLLHDINNAGWIVASGSGEGAARTFGTRFEHTDELLARLEQRPGTLRLSGAACVHRLNVNAGPAHSLVATASVGGRLYGAIELVSGPGAAEFTEPQANALAYLAEQFATFAASRGIVVRESEICARRTAEPGSPRRSQRALRSGTIRAECRPRPSAAGER